MRVCAACTKDGDLSSLLASCGGFVVRTEMVRASGGKGRKHIVWFGAKQSVLPEFAKLGVRE